MELGERKVIDMFHLFGTEDGKNHSDVSLKLENMERQISIRSKRERQKWKGKIFKG